MGKWEEDRKAKDGKPTRVHINGNGNRIKPPDRMWAADVKKKKKHHANISLFFFFLLVETDPF